MPPQSLDGDNWTVQAVGDLTHVPNHVRGKTFPARVPGCVHLDLIRAGVLRHPNQAYAERDQEWIGRTDWRFECCFTPDSTIASEPRARLRFECLDTIATVELNGTHIGDTANYHTEHSFTAGTALRPGENTLAVTITAPVPFVEHEHARLGRLPHNGDELGWHPFNMIRKPACNFGWDWGPRVATSGVQGPVALTADDPPPAWASVRRMSSSRWQVAAHIQGDLHANPSLHLSIDGSRVPLHSLELTRGEDSITSVSYHIDSPQLWWPQSHGDQPLYDLELVNGGTTHRWRIGFCHATLDTQPDPDGSRFTINVHDQPAWCRGANWIPDALFPAEATPERTRQRVQQAADANMNMLRVWGGGVYEQNAFYEACNELGILVWQDFMFACAVYPTTNEHLASIAREARQQSRRLAPHPSIALWCGGNECVEGYQHWGWKERMGDTPSDEPLYTETLFENLVTDRGSGAHYWPNSPWSGAVEDVRDPHHGDRHTWDLHLDDVRQIVPRFVSEFGRVAPACERTLREAGVLEPITAIGAATNRAPRASEGSEDQRQPGAPSLARGALSESPPWDDEARAALEHRLRQTGGSSVAYDPVLPEHFREPAADLRAWLWQTQVLQARALTTHIEWLRANAPRCMGALLWQLNDCWACQSWAIVDHAGRPKPAWYAVRRAFQPRRVTIQPLNYPRLSAVFINDTEEPYDAECTVRRITFSGTEHRRATAPLAADPRSLARIDDLFELIGAPDDPAAQCLVVEAAGDRDIWFFGRDRDLTLPAAPLRASLSQHSDRTLLSLHADSLARDIIIAADLLGTDTRAGDNCFTLLPGESREIEIHGCVESPDLPIDQLVRCASGPAR